VEQRAAIIGAGVMGLAAARSLARRGWAVTVYEQFELGHKLGSSHGRSRIFRLAYPDPRWVGMAMDALRGWRELEEESGTELLELNGLLEVVKSPDRSSGDALAVAGAAFELVGACEAQQRWPVRVPDGWTVLFQPEAGIVRADLAQQVFLDSARSHGAELRDRTRIDALEDVDADVKIVTAGAWVRKLLPSVAVRPTRETLAYFRRDGTPMASLGQLDPETRGHAQFSLHDPKYGLKAGVHHAGREIDPDEPDEPDQELVARIAGWVAQIHTDVDPAPVDVETCLYTNTDDENFVLERNGAVVVGSPCSGHGFKFAPIIGEHLADLAEAKV
jgi:monomeric sarcosine oxidase